MTTPMITEIRPQPGPQTTFLSTNADLAFYGGAAGGGKTWALLVEPLRHTSNPDFGFVIFRRTSPQIRNEGGLWDEASKIYPLLQARGLESWLEWRFPSGARGKFAALQFEQDVYNWQGSQIPFIGFDELTHFTENQFWYMLSRNRSMSGVKPYVRATTNPHARSWVKRLVAPWVDKTFKDPAESGEIRYFMRIQGDIHWHVDPLDPSPETRIQKDDVGPEGETPKSITFVGATIYDNKILLERNPEYLGNLQALQFVERKRLLEGDWDVDAGGGTLFRREWFHMVPEVQEYKRRVRFWDLAATEQRPGTEPDWTAGALLGESASNHIDVLDIRRVRMSPAGVEDLIKRTAEQDGVGVEIGMEIEPGSAGKTVVEHYARNVLRGYTFNGYRSTGSKAERAKPASSAVENGVLRLTPAQWNEGFLTEAELFPDSPFDDQVDAVVGAFNRFASSMAGSMADTYSAEDDNIPDRVKTVGRFKERF